MVSYIHAVSAVNILNNNPVPSWISESSYIKQLVFSLQVYKDRKEFQGDMITALQCLQLACYDLDNDCLKVLQNNCIFLDTP